MRWTKAQLDDGSRVRSQLRLPSIVALIFLHSCFGGRVPMARRLSGEISGFDKGTLNLGCSGVVDAALSLDCLCVPEVQAVVAVVRRRKARQGDEQNQRRA